MPRSRQVITDGVVIGLTTGAYGLSFGALGATAGFSWLQTQSLSLFLFSGASQFALVGFIGAGGGLVAALLTTWLLAARNGFYALRMAELLNLTGPKRWVAAQLTIDESTGLAMRNDTPENRSFARLGFWAAGISVYVFWNLATAAGFFAAALIDDPLDFGVDAAIAAAFLGLLWPRLKDPLARGVAVVSMMLAIALVPLTPIGVPVLACSFVALAAGLWVSRKRAT